MQGSAYGAYRDNQWAAWTHPRKYNIQVAPVVGVDHETQWTQCKLLELFFLNEVCSAFVYSDVPLSIAHNIDIFK
jgi:hypothetical protein